jgi:hypothetical protein
MHYSSLSISEHTALAFPGTILLRPSFSATVLQRRQWTAPNINIQTLNTSLVHARSTKGYSVQHLPLLSWPPCRNLNFETSFVERLTENVPSKKGLEVRTFHNYKSNSLLSQSLR